METGGPVPPQWQDIMSDVLVGSTHISARNAELAATLASDYAGLNPVLIVVLKGAFMFATDLSRALSIPHELEFIRASSYSGTGSTGTVVIHGLEHAKLAGRHVLVVEDIVDTGLTLSHIYARLKDAGAKSVKCIALLEKDTALRLKEVPSVDYIAFRIPDKFVVGYGLDFDQRWRHIPFVGVYKK